LVLAACGGDDSDDSGDADAPAATSEETAPGTDAGPDTTAGGADTTAPESTDDGGTGTTSGDSQPAGSAGCPTIDDSVDATDGAGAGRLLSDLECANDSPLAAEGEPVVIGLQNPEGDPNGSFPEFSTAAQAAVDYINAELGGWGADIQNGVAGRPIELQVCRTAISPDDSQRCANELLGSDPFLVASTINFFGNHLPIFQAAGVPAVVMSPVTIADFTSEGAYAIGGGGGCLGVHTGLIEFVTTDLGATNIGVPWADTPPGVVCYYDLEAKPMDVLNGTVEGSSERAGSLPDLQYLGVPIKPATPDVTPQVTEVLGADPDAIIFSGQGADCWNLVDGLGRLGWTPDDIPLVLSGACTDFEAMRAAGDLAKGIYFIGSGNSAIVDPATIEDPVARFEAETYQAKAAEYGMPEADVTKGFGALGFTSMITLWSVASELAASGEEVTAEAYEAALAATDNTHAFASTPLSCAQAPEPYIAVCNALVTANQWDGETFVPIRTTFSGIDLVAGTELRPGPS
jgi:branched-chain amino acid transport system substrate-binding protein